MGEPMTHAGPGAGVRTVVVVGAGFSGALVAVQLMRQARGPLRVLLVNASGRMARGLAYGTASAQHLLNVPAGNMSALADDADDFLRYCRWSAPQVQAHSFVPRRVYGAYLEALLVAAEQSLRPGVVLERVIGQVQALQPAADGQGATVTLVDGRSWPADAVVLAFGHFAPVDPLPAATVAALGARYVPDTWAAGALERIGPDDAVLLIGAGLTSLDVVVALAAGGHRAPLISLSRRGLSPQAHRVGGAPAPQVDGQALLRQMGLGQGTGEPTGQAQGALRQYLRGLRQAVRQAQAQGQDWRDVIGALRPHTPALWAALSLRDRARFLRHVRPYWDVLRHRVAPEAFQVYDGLRTEGRLQQLAARVRDVQVSADGAVVTLQPRGGGPLLQRTVQHIVNCTGPGGDVRRSGSALLQALLDQGLLQRDALGLGLEMDTGYHPLGVDGRTTPWLYSIGPMLKARDWEAIAVPELRVHAHRLAATLLG